MNKTIEHAIKHIGIHHRQQIGAAIVGTTGTAVGAGLSSVGLTTAGTAVTTAASGALATAGTTVTTIATTIVGPVVATATPIIVAGALVAGASYGLVRLGTWLLDD